MEGKTDRFRVRLTDGATCAAGAATGPAGKVIADGEIGDCDFIELDGGSVSSTAGKLIVNEVDGVLKRQPPAHAEVPFFPSVGSIPCSMFLIRWLILIVPYDLS